MGIICYTDIDGERDKTRNYVITIQWDPYSGHADSQPDMKNVLHSSRLVVARNKNVKLSGFHGTNQTHKSFQCFSERNENDLAVNPISLSAFRF